MYDVTIYYAINLTNGLFLMKKGLGAKGVSIAAMVGQI